MLIQSVAWKLLQKVYCNGNLVDYMSFFFRGNRGVGSVF